MVILQINSVYKVASTGRTCLELENVLKNKGHDVLTACKNVDIKSTVRIGSALDYKIHALYSRLTGKIGYYSKFSTYKLLKRIDQINPDVVHLRNLHSNYINVPILLKYLAQKDVPTVVTLHDGFFFTGKCASPNLSSCFKYKEQCGKCPQLRIGNKSWFFDRTRKMLNDKRNLFLAIPRLAVVGVSNWITDQTKGTFFDKASIRCTIYNWIDFNKFYPREDKRLTNFGITEDLPVVLGIASYWNSDKGYDQMVEMASLLKGKATLVLVGTVNERIKSDDIRYLGPIHDVDDLAQLYSSATVLFNPTKSETFGKTSAEAISCGTPVVAYDVCANKEIIGQGCGYVLPEHDILGAYSKILEIIHLGKINYEEMCLKYSRENFDKEKNIAQYLSVYEQLIGKKEN